MTLAPPSVHPFVCSLASYAHEKSRNSLPRRSHTHSKYHTYRCTVRKQKSRRCRSSRIYGGQHLQVYARVFLRQLLPLHLGYPYIIGSTVAQWYHTYVSPQRALWAAFRFLLWVWHLSTRLVLGCRDIFRINSSAITCCYLVAQKII